jgi:hypothetical protein
MTPVAFVAGAGWVSGLPGILAASALRASVSNAREATRSIGNRGMVISLVRLESYTRGAAERIRAGVAPVSEVNRNVRFCSK